MGKNEKLKELNEMIVPYINSKEEALPKDFNNARFVQNCLAVLSDVPDLEKYSNSSIVTGITKGAMLGLDFFNKEAYLIPYGSNLTFQTSYKGNKKIVKKYSINPILEIYAELLKEGDFLDRGIDKGKKYITWKPSDSVSDAPITGAFAVVLYKDGELSYEVMTKKEIEAVRDVYSKQATGKAWKNSEGEMMKKTVLNRLCKSIDLDFENMEQAKTYEESADVEFKKEKKEPIKATSSLDFDAEIIDVTPEKAEDKVNEI